MLVGLMLLVFSARMKSRFAALANEHPSLPNCVSSRTTFKFSGLH
jgi:hypothetical protein